MAAAVVALRWTTRATARAQHGACMFEQLDKLGVRRPCAFARTRELLHPGLHVKSSRGRAREPLRSRAVGAWT